MAINFPSGPTIGQTYVFNGRTWQYNAQGAWERISSAFSPAGTNTQVFFNDSATLNASAAFTFNKSTNTIVITGDTYIGPNNSLNNKRVQAFIHTNLTRIGTAFNLYDNYLTSVTVTNATDYISVSTAHNLVNGDIVQFLAGTLPTGISNNTNYYVINAANATHFQVSATEGGANVNITADGSTVDVYRPVSGSSTGPVEVGSGITVTVYNGCTWSVV